MKHRNTTPRLASPKRPRQSSLRRSEMTTNPIQCCHHGSSLESGSFYSASLCSPLHVLAIGSHSGIAVTRTQRDFRGLFGEQSIACPPLDSNDKHNHSALRLLSARRACSTALPYQTCLACRDRQLLCRCTAKFPPLSRGVTGEHLVSNALSIVAGISVTGRGRDARDYGRYSHQ
ncbi:uncharacterized protein M421DRAFT_326464 [Didymella exigua CBS 183.55]|uniref:Uncharacterized protein n=1 Tax=Didymella exigua CBS 183.55 TaxID=1150837 RepID=A0A6A5R6K4_9PLEO|nr:uncharacterized protein M421DRAFT_326464 [Didymella exigua CBS 183.55]KAF1923352.1 hypothetical protein M421DRAFT_326464 [Didymella exigua CBS 183.55]